MNKEEAVDAILDIFKTAWDTTGFTALYPGKEKEKPTSEAPWARVTIQHASGDQASLGSLGGRRRFREVGTLFVQVFAPVGDGSTWCYQLTQLLCDAYRDARHPEVWFRNVHSEEIGDDGSFLQHNVIATFIYDNVR